MAEPFFTININLIEFAVWLGGMLWLPWSEVVAAWVQAFVSVVAIVYGFKAIRLQHKLESEVRHQSFVAEQAQNGVKLCTYLVELRDYTQKIFNARSAEAISALIHIEIQGLMLTYAFNGIIQFPFDALKIPKLFEAHRRSIVCAHILKQTVSRLELHYYPNQSPDPSPVDPEACYAALDHCIAEFSAIIEEVRATLHKEASAFH